MSAVDITRDRVPERLRSVRGDPKAFIRQPAGSDCCGGSSTMGHAIGFSRLCSLLEKWLWTPG